MTQQDHSLATPQPADETTRRHSRRPHGGLWRWLAVILATFALAAVGTVIAFGRAYDGQIVQNVTIRGLSVSGLGPEESRAALRERYAELLQAPLTLTFGERSWAPTAEEIGLQIAIDAAVDRAFAVGRGPDALANLLERGTLLSAGRDLPLVVTLDEQRLNAYLVARADELAVAPRDATLSIVEGRVVVNPSAPGRAISFDWVDATIRPGLLVLEPQSVELTARELLPALDEDGIAETQTRLETLLAQPATVQIGEEVRSWTPAELGALVRIERVAGVAGVKLEATLVSQPIAAWLAELAPALERAPVEPRLRWREGAVQISEPGTDGARLDQAAALTQITDALWQGQGQIVVELTAVPPAIRPETLATLGIVEQVAEGAATSAARRPTGCRTFAPAQPRWMGCCSRPTRSSRLTSTSARLTRATALPRATRLSRVAPSWSGAAGSARSQPPCSAPPSGPACRSPSATSTRSASAGTRSMSRSVWTPQSSPGRAATTSASSMTPAAGC